ncbi:MAG: 50S ribosomal protein L21 [Candidatus Kerfeldbacteria bacterium]|nr:50S ribosomal protein L21 [Candidatus Kerfeldbacteria bacterium]
MIAIIQTGGKQYIVKEGDTLRVEKLETEAGNTVQFDTLMTSAEDASSMKLGEPSLGTSVTAEVVKQGRAKKILVRKFKAKVRYMRTYGHRQPFTEVKITKIA